MIPPAGVFYLPKGDTIKLSYPAESTFQCNSGVTWDGKPIIVKTLFDHRKRLTEGKSWNKLMKPTKDPRVNNREQWGYSRQVLHYNPVLPGDSSAQTQPAQYFMKGHKRKNMVCGDMAHNVRITLMPKLFPIEHLKNSSDLLAAIRDIVESKFGVLISCVPSYTCSAYRLQMCI